MVFWEACELILIAFLHTVYIHIEAVSDEISTRAVWLYY